MALALALSLAGFEEGDFHNLLSVFSVDAENRAASRGSTDTPRAASARSTRSDSSGISSLILSTLSSNYSTPPSSQSSASSRSQTPESVSPRSTSKAETTLLRVLHDKRDILNLAANLNDPSWNLKSPSIPRNDHKSFMANRSIHHRLGANALEEDYPVRVCGHCGFSEPSPYLF